MAIIFENWLLVEGKREYLAKYSDQPGAEGVVEKFWRLRHRVSAPKNDIDWWIRRPFGDLKAFVDGFDARPRAARRQDAHAAEAEKYGAKMLGAAGPYEVWFIPSHEAAQQIGRMYKGVSAKWCISTENPDYFYRTYANNEFVFMVKTGGKGDMTDDKLALQISGSGAGAELADVWDADDDKVTGDDEYDEADMWPLVDDALDMFRKSGLSRKKYQSECISRMLADDEWVRTKLFSDGDRARRGEDGAYVAEFQMDEIEDIIDDMNGDVDGECAAKILEGDYFDVFQPPDEPSFEYMDKAENAFNAVAGEHGVKWEDLEKVYAGRVPDGMDDEVYAWIEDHLDGDFFEDRGYYSEWSDCWVEGTGSEARSDVMDQLKKELGVLSCAYDDEAGCLMFTCEFSEAQLRDMAKLRIRGFTDDALHLSRYNCEFDDDDPEFEGVQIKSPYYGWSGFDENAMTEAAANFARRLVGFITMQKDAPGQTYFDFDRPDNPENLK